MSGFHENKAAITTNTELYIYINPGWAVQRSQLVRPWRVHDWRLMKIESRSRWKDIEAWSSALARKSGAN